MKNNLNLIFAIFLIGNFIGVAQSDTVTLLEEVIINDLRLKNYSDAYKTQVFTDSVLTLNQGSAVNLLRYNSTIYFRENGIGGIASASFRGTSAAQTAVVWNGININSQLNGQTDFTTLSTKNYDNITIRSGGGSVSFGSGAIGGSIHLNDKLKFHEHQSNLAQVSYGSFDTKLIQLRTTYGTDRFYGKIAAEYNASDNDFEFTEGEGENKNGAYENLNLNLGLGFYLTDKHLISLFQNTYLGEREFSGLLSGSVFIESDDFYEDTNSRTLINWQYKTENLLSKLSFAHLYEDFTFFDNPNSENYSFGKSINWLGRYDLHYNPTEKAEVNAVLQYDHIMADGSSFGNVDDRKILSSSLLWKQQLSDQFNYGLQVRQEIVADYESPLLLTVDATYQFSNHHGLKFNASRNYRIPTFNDLYWIGSGARGNKDLIPETSLQTELGILSDYKNFNFSLTGYFIKATDLINWRPDSMGVWSPVNVDEVHSYGLEFNGNSNHEVAKKTLLKFDFNYAFVKSVDQETDKQLIYVPEHKITVSTALRYHRWDFFYQFLHNGKVFISTDHSNSLEGYQLSNTGLGYEILDNQNINLKINLLANNIFNESYQVVGFRPMPGRNFQIQITSKF